MTDKVINKDAEILRGQILGPPYLIIDFRIGAPQRPRMARIARAAAPGFSRHVTQRGNRRQDTLGRCGFCSKT